MKRIGLAATALLLILALAPSADAATTWTARFAGRGLATLRVGVPSRLVIGLTGFRPGVAYTVTLRRGSCAAVGTLVLSTRVTASLTGRLSRTVTLTTAQTRAARLPLALRFGARCAAFALPVVAVPPPTPAPTPSPSPTPSPTPVPCGYPETCIGDGFFAKFPGADALQLSAVVVETWPGDTIVRPIDGHSLVTVRLSLVCRLPSVFAAAFTVTGPGGTYPALVAGRNPNFRFVDVPAGDWYGWLTFDVPNADVGRLRLNVPSVTPIVVRLY